MTVVKVKAKGGRKIIVKSTPVIDYNTIKAGVDRMDPLISYYPFHRKTLK